jgi:hypothetical protein
MSMRARLSATVLLTLAACAGTAQDRPAVLTNPDADTRAALMRIISEALYLPTVTLADDAFTRDSLLIIERQPVRDAAGRRVSGRELDGPEHFRLILSGTHCVVVHVRTERRYELKNTRCTKAPPQR